MKNLFKTFILVFFALTVSSAYAQESEKENKPDTTTMQGLQLNPTAPSTPSTTTPSTSVVGCEVKLIEIPSAKGGSRIVVPEINGKLDLEKMKLGKGWYVTDVLNASDDQYTVTRKKNRNGVDLEEKDQKIWNIIVTEDNSKFEVKEVSK